MKELSIKVSGIHDICRLTAAAQLVDGDVTIKRGRHAIDAKSVMGAFSIDMSDGVTIQYPASASDFENFLQEFI